MAGHVLKTALLFLALTLPIIAQSQTPCIAKCPPNSSFCDGDETGAALDTCTCQSFYGKTDFFSCVKACPTNEQQIFAGHLPTLCRSTLMPGVDAITTSSGSAATTTKSSSSASSAASTSSSSPSATSAGIGSTTSSGSTASPSASGNAASGFGVDAVKMGAFAGGVAILIL